MPTSSPTISGSRPAIAAALERALPDVPEHEARLAGADVGNLFVYFSGVGRLWLRALIAFCRAGSFFVRFAPPQPAISEGDRAA